MQSVSSEITVDLPVRTVYDQWTQFEDFPAFMEGVEEVRQLDDAHLYWLVRVGAVERGFEAEIIEQKPDERIVWRSTEGPKQSGIVTFQSLGGDRTVIRLQLDWEPEGLVEKVGAFFQADEARVQSDLREFVRLMESNGFATGAWRGDIDREASPRHDHYHFTDFGADTLPDPGGRDGARPGPGSSLPPEQAGGDPGGPAGPPPAADPSAGERDRPSGVDNLE